MAISVIVPSALAQFAEGRNQLSVHEQCSTVRAALGVVAARWPALTDRVLTEQGDVRRHVNVFVGDESIRFLDGLSTAIDDGATITIVPAVSGG